MRREQLCAHRRIGTGGAGLAQDVLRIAAIQLIRLGKKDVGKAIPRRDIPAKVTGGAAYVQDIRLPGMLHGRVVRPPRYGAKLESFDQAAAKAGRQPSEVRRLYNVSGQITEGALTELALEHGMDTFILWFEGDVESQLRRFAAEVAPAVRRDVARARG